MLARVNAFQVKFYMEAPRDGTISRDFFVAFSAYYGLTILQIMLSEGYDVSAAAFLEGYDSEDLDAPIGTPDLELSVIMTGEGYQLEIRNTLTNKYYELPKRGRASMVTWRRGPR